MMSLKYRLVPIIYGHTDTDPIPGADTDTSIGIGASLVVMVSCVCYKCSKWSDVDKDISFYRIPAIRKDRDETELELN